MAAPDGRTKDAVCPPAGILVPMVIAIAVGIDLLQRWIVGQAQPAVVSDVDRAADAIRSSSVHARAGAGLSMLLVILGLEFVAIATISELEVVRWTLPVLGVGCLIA